MNEQAKQLVEWRAKLCEMVLLPLVDKEDSDVKGDEYEISTKQQDEVYVYMDALRAIVSDRHDTLTGQINERIKLEMKSAMDLANAGEGHSPELMKKLLSTTLRSQLDKGNTRAGTELQMIDSLHQGMKEILNVQNKSLTVYVISELFFTCLAFSKILRMPLGRCTPDLWLATFSSSANIILIARVTIDLSQSWTYSRILSMLVWSTTVSFSTSRTQWLRLKKI